MLSQRSIGAAGTGLVLPSDDEFNRVSFLSHFDGTNNGTNNVFDDSSSSNHTITSNGDATQGSFGPFARPDGEWGVSFDGSGDYLSTPANSLDMSNNNFTIESWVYTTVTGQRCIVGATKNQDGTGAYMMNINYNGAQVRFFCRYNGGTVLNYTVGSGDFPTNAWTHLAVTRDGSSLRVFINGTQVGTTNTTLGSFAIDNASLNGNIYYIGRTTDGANEFTGNLSNLRVVIGTAVYTSNFTPSSSSLTAVTNTEFLGCQSNRFVDNSASAHTITPSGDAAVSAFGPFLTSEVYDAAVNGASAYFPATGNNDFLESSASSDYQFGTGDLTVELWSYNLYSADARNYADNRANATGWKVGRTASNLFQVFSEGSGGVLFEGGSAPNNTWIHFCWTRASGVNKFFINGVQSGSNVSNSDDFNSNSLKIGTRFDSPGGSSQEVKGYISDLRIIKGTAVEPSGIPTAPLTAVTNTKLLLNMADGQAIDSAAQNNLTLVGTAKTSTAQSAFGTASLLLDGDSDLAKIPSASGDLGSGDWTIEFSFRLSADVGGTAQTCMSKWESSGDERGWAVRLASSSGNKMQFRVTPDGTQGSIVSTTFSTAFSHSTWYNVALVNSSGTVTLYVDGTADATTYTLASGEPRPNVGIDVAIGAAVPSSPNTFFNGYIDEVRISKVARHTSSYTPAAFPDKGQ